MTDAVSLYLERYRRSSPNPLWRLFLGIELRRMIRFERIIQKFDKGLVCSPADRDLLTGRVPHARIALLENGVDLEMFSQTDTVHYDQNRIILTGNMSYFPNADGARYLVEKIFPMVKKSVPLAKLYIVGQSPPRSVRNLESKDVVVTGFVQDIRAEYLKSSVAVSPIRFGAGTLNKVLEPLALGIPVVSTSLGIKGLDLEIGKDILVSDDSNGFAENVVRVLTDRHLRAKLARSATDKVRTRFSWTKVASRLEQYYGEVLEESAGIKSSKETAQKQLS